MNADKRRFENVAGLFVLITGSGLGQSFEVASVKVNNTPAPPTMTELPGGERFRARNMPLIWLIGAAYNVPNRQISGLPQEFTSGGYDIEAKAGHSVSREQMMILLRKLLEDRFKLMVRRETKELKAYVLVAAKSGVRLEENQDGAELAMRKVSGNKMSYHNMPMPLFANVLSGAVDDVVVDGTGLKGSYDFTLEYYAGPGGRGVQEGREPAPDPNAASIYTALQEQLGLKLESRKGPVGLLVIDRIERLSGN
jgi:uncharacterized protein (TIGR03435 family)